MNNIFNMASQFQQFMQNPAGMMSRMGIPQQFSNSPDNIIQYLMNNGKISQQQYNQAVSMAKQLQNSPQFQQMFKRN